MNGKLKKIIVLFTTLALVAVPCMTCFAQGLEQDDDVIAGKMAGDALVARPLGLCTTIIGGVLFLVSLPFSALGPRNQPVASIGLVAARLSLSPIRLMRDDNAVGLWTALSMTAPPPEGCFY